MEERIAALEKELKELKTYFAKFMQGPYMQQKNFLNRLVPLVNLYESGEGLFAAKSGGRRTRKSLNREDWFAVQGALDNNGGTASWNQVSKITGIPASTCRKYAKMSPEEVEALPQSGEVGDESAS